MAKSRKKVVPTQAVADASDSGLNVSPSPQSAGDTTTAKIGRDRIAERAYELYLQRGAVDGRDMDDWFAAERELVGVSAPGRRER
jgi:hypothetical protein